MQSLAMPVSLRFHPALPLYFHHSRPSLRLANCYVNDQNRDFYHRCHQNHPQPWKFLSFSSSVLSSANLSPTFWTGFLSSCARICALVCGTLMDPSACFQNPQPLLSDLCPQIQIWSRWQPRTYPACFQTFPTTILAIQPTTSTPPSQPQHV